MQAAHRDLLKERHRFPEWAGRTEVPVAQPIRGFALSGNEVPGWKMEPPRRLETRETPLRTTTFWRGDRPEAVLRVDVFETASVDAAHEFLIDALGEFETTIIERRPGIGDVAFGTDTVVLFARGNIVMLVRNAGRQVVRVADAARALDVVVLNRVKAQ